MSARCRKKAPQLTSCFTFMCVGGSKSLCGVSVGGNISQNRFKRFFHQLKITGTLFRGEDVMIYPKLMCGNQGERGGTMNLSERSAGGWNSQRSSISLQIRGHGFPLDSSEGNPSILQKCFYICFSNKEQIMMNKCSFYMAYSIV